MARRAIHLVLLAVLAFGAYVLATNRSSDVVVLNARSVPLNGSNDRYMVTFEIQNDGPPITLTGMHSTSAEGVHIMNPDNDGAPLVIPENSRGIFAMDGAHVMIAGVAEGFEEGTSLPLTLTFAEISDVTTRVLHAGGDTGMAGMTHDMSNGVQSETSPQVTLTFVEGPSPSGADITVDIENFTFARTPDDAPHVPNEGHGHIYLNGLKLGRLYEPTFTLGAVPAGAYDLVVRLNSNTHQPYMNGDTPVADWLSFEIPE